MNFYIETLGCKVNKYDSDVIAAMMREKGFEQSLTPDADITVINSCTVTQTSDKKARRAVEHARRTNPLAIIVLTGCFAQAFPDEAAKTSADIVVGVADRHKIPSLLSEYLESRRKTTLCNPHPTQYDELNIPALTDKTRAYIKIEDGCNRFCSYCIIPYARGRVRSRSLESIRDEVEIQARGGHKEIVLVGINLSCYGKDISLTLADAVEEAEGVDGIERIRLSSLEPELLDEKMIKRLSECRKLCPHFHLSLQSGCDETLKRMNRKYTCEEYEEIVRNLRREFPDCAITTDIMVGFPGETDEEFEKSLLFAQRIGFSKIHVFTYSEREGTAAAGFPDKIPEEIKAERYKRMSELDMRLHAEFLSSQTGKIFPVLIQKRTSPDFAYGLTPNYTGVRIYGSNAEKHDVVNVRITTAEKANCVGEEL